MTTTKPDAPLSAAAVAAIERNRAMKSKRIAQRLIAEQIKMLKALDEKQWQKLAAQIGEENGIGEVTRGMIIRLLEGLTK